jgi:glutamine synthetase
MLRTSLNMDYYHDLYDLATNFGVEVEAHRESSFPLADPLYPSKSFTLTRRCSLFDVELILDTETGPGVFETALAYTDSGRMADNAILFKFVAKSVGMKHGITPTFMAKPYSDVNLPSPNLY